MEIIKALIGHSFLTLISECRENHEIIKEGGGRLFQKSTPILESYFSKPVFMQSIPNPISIGLLCLVFIIIYVCGIARILDQFDLSPPIYVSFFFPALTIVAIFLASIPFAIGRGKKWGVNATLTIYLLGLTITLISISLTLAGYFTVIDFGRKIKLIPIQIIAIYLARCIINGDSFHKLVSYFQTKRLVFEVCKIKQRDQE